MVKSGHIQAMTWREVQDSPSEFISNINLIDEVEAEVQTAESRVQKEGRK